jgi:hypothetical protein
LNLVATNGITTLNKTNYTVTAAKVAGVSTYTVTLNVPVTSTTGVYAITATVLDRSGNISPVTSLGSFTIANEALATVELQGFLGASRNVTFVATDLAGAVLSTWTKSVTNFAAGVGSIFLENVPAGTTSISAKTAWTLRSKKSATFSPEGVGAISLTGADQLPGGDLNGDNVINTIDYGVLRYYWTSPDPTADITGNGVVTLPDYAVMSSNFYTIGDDL